MLTCQRCGKEHEKKYGSGRYCSKICAYTGRKRTKPEKAAAPLKNTLNIKNTLEYITRMYSVLPNNDIAEPNSEHALRARTAFAQFVLGDSTYRQFRKVLTEMQEEIQQTVLDPLANILQETSAIAYVNAWYDVARYQTDVKDSALQWGVDECVLQLLLATKPAPTTPDERHALTVPHEVKRARESFFERILSPAVYQKIVTSADDVAEATLQLGDLFHSVPDDLKEVPVHTMTVCQFQHADVERIKKILAARQLTLTNKQHVDMTGK